MENASNTEKAPVSLLSQARIAAGLSLQQLTEITKIPSRYLQALESHDYDNFPSNLFVIGYLRNCADVLAVDINVLLLDYDLEKLKKTSTVIDVPEHTEVNQRCFSSLEKHQLKWLLCSFVASLVVILAVFLFLVSQNAQKSDDVIDKRELFQAESVFSEDDFISEPADLIASEGVADNTVRSIDVIAQSEETRTDELATDLDALDPTEEVSRQNTIPSATAEPKLVADQASALIELAFNGVCWVDLTDGRGQRVYRDLAKKGSKLAFSVKMPLELLLGDARQVDVFLNGQPFAIQSYRDDNSVRLTIDAL